MNELRECLAEILRAPVPPADDEPCRFYGHWLLERNLALVPIADPATFSLATHWIARVDGHALVMYGSPPGPWLDPAQAYGSAPIDAGWHVAPLDLHYVAPTEAGTGTVAALLVAPDAEAPLTRVDEVEARAGHGLAGDRYFDGRGTFSRKGRGYELTLVDADVLDELDLPWEDARRNVVTRGIDLNALAGRPFRIGDVACIGRRLCEPCAHLDRLAGRSTLRPLLHRGGLRADIVADGTIRVGDEVSSR